MACMPIMLRVVTSNWILMDYVSVVVNIFLSEARELYALERLWGDAKKADIDQYLNKDGTE